MDQATSINQRHATRHDVAATVIRLFDDDNDLYLGRVLDVGTRGLRILGRLPIPRNREFTLRLEVENDDPLLIKGMGRWAEESGQPGEYLSGFSFDTHDSATHARLKELSLLAPEPAAL